MRARVFTRKRTGCRELPRPATKGLYLGSCRSRDQRSQASELAADGTATVHGWKAKFSFCCFLSRSTSYSAAEVCSHVYLYFCAVLIQCRRFLALLLGAVIITSRSTSYSAAETLSCVAIRFEMMMMRKDNNNDIIFQITSNLKQQKNCTWN